MNHNFFFVANSLLGTKFDSRKRDPSISRVELIFFSVFSISEVEKDLKIVRVLFQVEYLTKKINLLVTFKKPSCSLMYRKRMSLTYNV